ncbi:MAG: hypothetical protein Q9160_006290 [Pyrenula sp. 1 TL-2023]
MIELVSSSILDEYVSADQWSSVQFIHQTAQEFVREGILGLPNPVKPGEHHFKASGSRLIALACLDRHPFHHHLRRVSKKLFAYLRDVEQEIDTSPQARHSQLQSLPRWAWDSSSRVGFALHMFPLVKRGNLEKMGSNRGLPQWKKEDFSCYLEDRERFFLFKTTNGIVSASDPIVIAMAQNLYHTVLNTFFVSKPGQLLYAALGPRLSKDRLDRPRMFRQILSGFDPKRLDDDFIIDEATEVAIYYLGINRGSIEIDRLPLGLLSCLVIAERSEETTDEDILKMAALLLDAGATTSRALFIRLSQENPGEVVGMSLLNYCARFKGDMSRQWVELLRRYGARLLSREQEMFNELVQSCTTEENSTIRRGWEPAELDPTFPFVALSGACLSAVGAGTMAFKGLARLHTHDRDPEFFV